MPEKPSFFGNLLRNNHPQGNTKSCSNFRDFPTRLSPTFMSFSLRSLLNYKRNCKTDSRGICDLASSHVLSLAQRNSYNNSPQVWTFLHGHVDGTSVPSTSKSSPSRVPAGTARALYSEDIVFQIAIPSERYHPRVASHLDGGVGNSRCSPSRIPQSTHKVISATGQATTACFPWRAISQFQR